MNYSSKILEQAVESISHLPGIGRKSALRLALFLLKQDTEDVQHLAKSLLALKKEIQFCRECHNLSDKPICEICDNASRESEIICVVEDIRDVMAIENTHNYVGKYHVIGGLISPMDGVGPSQLNIDSLVERIKRDNATEVILGLNATMEGDTTAFYIYRKIQDLNIQISTIARGIAVGDALEYTDEVTLGRSIQNRVPYAQSISSK